jgi:uncharacterized pyridoxamine 5'-phosphate oxidase family protein
MTLVVLIINILQLNKMKKLFLIMLATAGFAMGASAQTNLKGDGMKEVYDFLKKCGTYYLATVEGNQPRVRPFGTVNIFEGKLYFQTSRTKNVSKQMAANPKVEICAYDGAQWIRVEAIAVDDNRREPKQSMLDAYPSLQKMYSADDNNTQTLYLKDVTATFYGFGGEPKVVKF